MRTSLALALMLLAPGAALAQPAPAAATAESVDAQLAAFFEAFDAAQLKRSPEGQSYRGIRTDYGKWSDQSDRAAQVEHAANGRALVELRSRFGDAKLSPESQLSYRLFEKQMERRIKAFPFRHYNYVFDQNSGAQSRYTAFLINIHRVGSKADAEAYVSRLEGLGTAIDQNIAESERRETLGVLPPKWVFPFVIGDARNVISGAPFEGAGVSPLQADFAAKLAALKLPEAEAQALQARADAALTSVVGPAFTRFIAAAERQQGKAGNVDGVWRFKDGAQYYQTALDGYTTTAMTADQIHDLGLAQVKRIHGEMAAVQAQLGFKGSFAEFLVHMRDNKAFVLPDGDAGKAEWLGRANGFLADIGPKLPQYFKRLPVAPVVVKAVEPFREKSAGKAFYQSPAADGSRPGTVYVNLYRMIDMPTIEIEALTYHEGMPGHHLERANSTELKNLPPFRRFGGFTAYTEGWGLYTERLAKDMGQYREPNSDFGRLQLELHRAIRLVVDTGIHHKRWSKDEAAAYTRANSADPLGGIDKAMERYAVSPGQATAYMIGRLKILDLRARAEKALGTKFDIREFHDVILKTGAVPLDILEENVDAWVAGVGQGRVAD
ncbi:uncharacterized protein (DUF885 family) [Polymorphobacter multimanifer]|uniref:Uncharacterized protein (DUF885 family) n=1 Tax=Polymorphobacter multimanifer TaxID=1070431 RepID=A0A841LDP0_9SPHN|nr:DUF885 domain-containing protein [Polymorphobacter multimanifer]MBB6227098.1 uncharacterized protein (DUF885 family) [Polymorphobacter multimanifer]